MLLSILAAQPAAARSFDDLLGAGFVVAKVTTVAGDFTGCRPNARVTLADGHRFACGETYPHYALRPRVMVLRNLATGDVAVTIDGREYSGGLEETVITPASRKVQTGPIPDPQTVLLPVPEAPGAVAPLVSQELPATPAIPVSPATIPPALPLPTADGRRH